MKTINKITAAALALLMIFGAVLPAFADAPLPRYDETFYATLDYYGSPNEASVVKSYYMNGGTKIIDYGDYDSVENLTDDRTPALSGGSVEFDFGDESPKNFYFEGKTKKPLTDVLPFNISLSYRLNGVDTTAEKLAGEKGLVEINLDITPNENAADYFKNNFILTAATMFADSDILSLEADGAQVQLIGNLRSVIYVILPGEEQHFVMKVGSEDFAFSGFVFMSMPATLAQLEKVADIRGAKDTLEKSYNEISDSLDTILETLEGMSGGIKVTADGLRDLDSARQTISDGSDKLYDQSDALAKNLTLTADDLEPLAGHLDNAKQAVDESVKIITSLCDNATSLKEELEKTDGIIDDIKNETGKLRDICSAVSGRRDDIIDISESLEENLSDLGGSLSGLKTRLAAMRTALAGLSGMSAVDEITVDGKTVAEILELVETANRLHTQYLGYLAQNGLSENALDFATFLEVGAQLPPEQAQSLAELYAYSKTDEFESKIEEAETANNLIGEVNGKMGEVNALIAALATPTAGLLASLETLCAPLGKSGLTGDLSDIVSMINEILDETEEDANAAGALLYNIDELGDVAKSVIEKADGALESVGEMKDLVIKYQPGVQSSLDDAKKLSVDATAALKCAATFVSTLTELIKASGDKLDSGAEKSLTGLADALEKGAAGLDKTFVIKDAKDVITNLIDDKWDEYTGEDNRMLLMDAGAKAQSMTSDKNASPESIQFILRSAEIQVESEKVEESAEAEREHRSFWQKIGDMFVGIWNFIVGIFVH